MRPIVVPMDFLRVPLTAAAGWLIYSERLDIFTVLGAALILTGNLLNLKPSDPVPARAGNLMVACAQLSSEAADCDVNHASRVQPLQTVLGPMAAARIWRSEPNFLWREVWFFRVIWRRSVTAQDFSILPGDFRCATSPSSFP